MSKIKIFMGVPSTGTRSDAQCYALRNLEKKYGDKIEFIYPKYCVYRIFHDFARNMVTEEFLQSEADILWFLDSDIVPPSDCLDIVLYPTMEWKVAGCPYPVCMTVNDETGPQIVWCVYDKNSAKGLRACDVPTKGIKLVGGLATGCMFIKREVFSQLEKPYFSFDYHPETRELIGGEDLRFCKAVNALGYEFYTDFSKVCKHYKQVDLLDMDNYARTLVKSKLMEYDAQIRGQVETLQAQVAQVKTQPKKSSLVLPSHYKR